MHSGTAGQHGAAQRGSTTAATSLSGDDPTPQLGRPEQRRRRTRASRRPVHDEQRGALLEGVRVPSRRARVGDPLQRRWRRRRAATIADAEHGEHERRREPRAAVGQPALGGQAAERHHDQQAEQRQPGEDQERQQVVDEVAELLVAVEADVVHALLRDTQPGRRRRRRAMPAKITPRIGWRCLNVTGISSAATPTAGIAYTTTAGTEYAQPIQAADPLGSAEVGLDSDPVVDEQVDDGAEQHGQRQQHPQRADQRRPREQRHTAHRHARRPSGEHRRGDAPRRGQQPDDHQAVAGEEQVDGVSGHHRRSRRCGPARPTSTPGRRARRSSPVRARRGKAIWRAPSWSGTTAIESPSVERDDARRTPARHDVPGTPGAATPQSSSSPSSARSSPSSTPEHADGEQPEQPEARGRCGRSACDRS